MIVTIIVTASAVLACAALYAAWPRPLTSRRENEHDPALVIKGVRYTYEGHDQAQGERGFKSTVRREKRVRKAAALKSTPAKPPKIASIADRRRA